MSEEQLHHHHLTCDGSCHSDVAANTATVADLKYDIDGGVVGITSAFETEFTELDSLDGGEL